MTKSDDLLPHPSVFLGEERLKLIRGYKVHEDRTPRQSLRALTPSQTVGPFHALGLVRPTDNDVARREVGGPKAEGVPIRIVGRVSDERGRSVRKALIEIWQANRWGKYEHPDDVTDAPLDPHFKGWGRALTNSDGQFEFHSIKPGAYPNPGYDNWMRPPHVHFSVFAAGVMERLITQMYFPGEPLNDVDPILNGIEDLRARASLIARRLQDADGLEVYEFNLVLKGREETTFFVER